MFVIDDTGQLDRRPKPSGEEFAGGERKLALFGTARLQFRGVNPIDPYPDEKRLAEPDIGAHIVAVHDALDFGRDRPRKRFSRDQPRPPSPVAAANSAARGGKARKNSRRG